MKPWEVLERTSAPDGTELTLVRHPSELAILANGQTLMSSRAFASEKGLAVRGCHQARTLANPCVLVGGLGMGFTVRAALDVLPPTATVVVAELVPAVVEWNRTILGPLAQHPLDDPRVRVDVRDVADVLHTSPSTFDAVLLDVDNGAEALTVSSNNRLYSERGVASMRAALRPDGVLAVWSAGIDRLFERRLRAAGFRCRREQLHGHGTRGRRYTIVLATPPPPK